LLSRTGARVAGNATAGPVDHHQTHQTKAGNLQAFTHRGTKAEAGASFPTLGALNPTTRAGTGIDGDGEARHC